MSDDNPPADHVIADNNNSDVQPMVIWEACSIEGTDNSIGRVGIKGEIAQSVGRSRLGIGLTRGVGPRG